MKKHTTEVLKMTKNTTENGQSIDKEITDMKYMMNHNDEKSKELYRDYTFYMYRDGEAFAEFNHLLRGCDEEEKGIEYGSDEYEKLGFYDIDDECTDEIIEQRWKDAGFND